MIRIKGEEITLSRFPDGTLHLTPNLPDISLEEPSEAYALITWNYESDEEMAAILFLTKHLKKLGYKVSLDMPYIPNARQDRVKGEKDVFTLKYFAEFINSLDFDKVFVLDPHSNVSAALIDKIIVESPETYCDQAIQKIYDEIEFSPLMAFYPDEGAMKRYSESYGLECAYAAKNRDWQTGKILGLEVIGNADAVKGRNIIIIDDICSKGGTFYYAAKKLKELGANKIFLFVTHCEKTVFEGELFKSGLIDKLFTTDSIFTPSVQEMAKSKGVADKIEVIPLSMKKTNAMLLIDFYKAVHAEMLPKNITKSVSYFTPRMSRVKRWDSVVMFGLQGFIKEYLIDYFNDNFFNVPFDEAIADYQRIMDATLGANAYNIKKIKKLHELGYLPIEIVALPEGTLVPMHVPMFGITNTHKDFAWLPQSLESLISAEMWHPMLAANVGYTYRQIVNKYYDETCDDDIPRAKALGAFDFRGEECLQSATKAGAGWLLSFLNTATVPAIPYLEKYYNCDCTKEPVGFGSPSTEHSVMCSNFAVDGDEITLLRRLLTEIYPNTSFSAVLDSYDYWNVIDNILPQLKPEILTHNGCMLMRGDSGDCIEVVTKTVFKLWDIFGGTVNSKGYKVLDPHVKAIYGDSITVQRCEKIYEILKENGFACSNVALGVGSFSFQCIEEDDYVEVTFDNDTEIFDVVNHRDAVLANGTKVRGIAKTLKPFTRDTFSSCIKATYCEIDDKPTPIFKDPKDGGFKKSQKGCCVVTKDYEGNLSFYDQQTWEEARLNPNNLLETVFCDGHIVKEQTVAEVRSVLHGGKF